MLCIPDQSINTNVVHSQSIHQHKCYTFPINPSIQMLYIPDFILTKCTCFYALLQELVHFRQAKWYLVKQEQWKGSEFAYTFLIIVDIWTM